MLGRLRKLIVLLLKLAVTAGLLWWVLSGVRWHDHAVDRATGREHRVLDARPGQVQVQTGAGPQWRPVGQFQALGGRVVRVGLAAALMGLRGAVFAAAAALLAVQLTLMGVRWWYLMRFEGLGVGLGATVRLMFIGHFFNFFLPGSTGGDVIRAYLVTRRTAARTVAVATVLLDRFAGLAGMAFLAGAMTLITWGSPQTRQAATAVGVTMLVIVSAGLVLFSRRIGRAIRLDALIDRLPRRQNLRIAIDALRELPRSPKAVAAVGTMTLGVHLLLAGGIATLGAALGLPVPAHLYFLFIPVIYILAAIPVSIGGLGVVEGMYVLFFAPYPGVDVSAVLALALLARFTPMLLSLPGLVCWLTERGGRENAAEDGPARDGGAGPPAPAGDCP